MPLVSTLSRTLQAEAGRMFRVYLDTVTPEERSTLSFDDWMADINRMPEKSEISKSVEKTVGV